MSCYLKLKYTRETRFVNTSIGSSLCDKLLGITLDSELKLEEYDNKICNIVNKKVNALHRIGSYMRLMKNAFKDFH